MSIAIAYKIISNVQWNEINVLKKKLKKTLLAYPPYPYLMTQVSAMLPYQLEKYLDGFRYWAWWWVDSVLYPGPPMMESMGVSIGYKEQQWEQKT